MPIRSLSSPILKWPNADEVKQAIKQWTDKVTAQRHDIIRIGFFGSYARGDWSVGSDLDIVAVIKGSKKPFEKRTVEWDLTSLPVPADLLVYTRQEWDSFKKESRFFKTVAKEAIWLYEK